MTELESGSAAEQALALADRLAKPPGSLGRLEEIAVRLAEIACLCPPPAPSHPAVAVFAADHGVVASGVGVWPQEITAVMVQTMASGRAAINSMARVVGAGVTIVDVGVNADLTGLHGVNHSKVRLGTADLSIGSAMTEADASAAVDVGRETAEDLISTGADLLVGGDMGIGNTTAAGCLVAVLTATPAGEVVGPGAGSTADTLATKRAVIEAAVARASAHADPLTILADVGGLEIAALVGLFLEAAANRIPIVVDGAIAVAALTVAEAMDPGTVRFCFAGHLSPEPAARLGLEYLGLHPLLDLEMRLGEGTGGCLAVPLLQAAARSFGEMATLEELR